MINDHRFKKMKRGLAALLVTLMASTPLAGLVGSDLAAVETADPAANALDEQAIETTQTQDAPYVIQFAIDGLSNSMFDRLKAAGAETPHLDSIIAEGTRLGNVEALLPAYVGSYSTAITGASPASNRTTYRYFDVEANQIVAQTSLTYAVETETIFDHLKETGEASFLASGWAMDELALTGVEQFIAGHENFDPDYELRIYKSNSVSETAPDILEALGRDEIPQYMSLMASDLTRIGWGGIPEDYEAQLVSTLSAIDTHIGEIMDAAAVAGIADQTYYLVHSLTPIYENAGRVTTLDLAAAITADTGVTAQELNGHGRAPAAGTKVVLPKHFVWNYAQLTFTQEATEEDKAAVLTYLEDPSTNMGQHIHAVRPIESFAGAPQDFADYILEPVAGKTFAAAGASVTRNDLLAEYDLFTAVKGPGIEPGSAANSEGTLMDIVPTITDLLGTSNPEQTEGQAWTLVSETEEPGTELPDLDNPRVIQIAIDGLSNDLYNRLKAQGTETPNLDRLINEGSRVEDVQALLPAYVGSYSTAVTGASPASNRTSYRYFDVENNRLNANTGDTYRIDTETIFSHLKHTDQTSFLASGWAMDELQMQGIDEFKAGHADFDPSYEIRTYRTNSISETAPDILDALSREDVPQYMSLMASDITRAGWGGAGADFDEQLGDILTEIDGYIGQIIAAAENAGIADETYFLVHSLTPIFHNQGKVTTLNLAAAITEDTGVAVQEISSNGASPRADVKAVIVKQYVWNYAQLAFTNEATEEDRQQVLEYLQDPSSRMGLNIRKVHPIADFDHTPQDFADYILEPVPGRSFSSPAASVTRNDILAEYDLFTAVKGPGIAPGTSVPGEPTLMDLVPTISNFLGTTTADSVEGTAWTFRHITPAATLSLQYPRLGQAVFSDTITLIGNVAPADSPVHVNGTAVTADADGVFRHTLSLDLGRNDILVEAWNVDGKRSFVETMVNYVVRPDLPEGNHILYMNWDGFADHQLEEALDLGIAPNLQQIIAEGTRFENLRASLPGITNSAQAAIVSGTGSRHTNNHLRYFDKTLNRAVDISPRRTNLAETLAESASRQNLDLVSINQFAVEDRGATSGDPLANYVGAGNSDQRFDALLQLIETNELAGMEYEALPRVILFYVDEIDAYGHNEGVGYRSETAAGRHQNILDTIQHYDARLGEVMDAMKDQGVYEDFTFLLTSDHGMAQWGRDHALDTRDLGRSKMPDVIERLNALGEGFKTSYVYPNDQSSYNVPAEPSADADIAVTSYGLSVQLSYVNEYDEAVIAEKNAVIEEALKDLDFVGEFWGPEYLQSRGVGRKYADLLIGIVPQHHVHHPSVPDVPARGGHGGIDDVEQMIPGLLWGKDIRAGFTVEEEADVIDMIPTLSYVAGINAPLDATGKIHYDIIEGAEAPDYTHVTLEAEDLALWGDTKVIEDENAIGRLAVTDVQGADSQIAIPYLPISTERIDVMYQAPQDVMVRLTVNGQTVRDIFFPETTWAVGEYDVKQLNISLQPGDELRLQALPGTVYTGTLTIDAFNLYSLDRTPAYQTEASPVPFNLVATPNGNTNTQLGFSWLTNHQGLTNELLIVEGNDPETADWSEAEVFAAESRYLSMIWESDGRAYESHQAIANGLEADTEYLWRVRNGETLSEIGRVRTNPTRNGSYRMIYLTDPQGKTPADYDIWGQTVAKVSETSSPWDLFILPGDMIDTGLRVPNNAREWEQFFSEAPAAFRNSLFVPAIGNHEARDNQGFRFLFNTEHALPGALPANSVYSFDYGNVHYSVLNTEMLDSQEQFAPQVEWLREDMAATDADWKIVVLHKGLNSVGGHITDVDINTVLIPMLEPVLDELSVDVVLQGHDHVYARSHKLKDGAISEDGTVYLTMNTAGFKFYDVHADAELEFFARYGQPREQMYSVIDVTPDSLTFKAYTVVSDELYDSFTLTKDIELPHEDPMDLDGDGVITLMDLSILTANYRSNDPRYDLNSDGVVDALDLAMLIARID